MLNSNLSSDPAVHVVPGFGMGRGVGRTYAPGIRGVIVVNMRWDLGYWRRQRDHVEAATGKPWVLQWKSRGIRYQHTVTPHDIETYASVPMASLAALRGVAVLVCYGWGRDEGHDYARTDPSTYRVDGVVPVHDVETVVNTLAGHCTLRFVPGAGHNVREPGTADKLASVVLAWLRETLDTTRARF